MCKAALRQNRRSRAANMLYHQFLDLEKRAETSEDCRREEEEQRPGVIIEAGSPPAPVHLKGHAATGKAYALEKKSCKRARWGARNLIHDFFEDGFPSMRDRFARKRIAAEQKYEYNLGTRSFETPEAAEDGMAWLRALFTELDNQCDSKGMLKTSLKEDAVPPECARRTLREFLEAELVHWRIQPSARVGRGATAPGKPTTPHTGNHLDSYESTEVYFEAEGPLGMDLKPCANGVQVLSVQQNGLADSAGIRLNDVIVQVNDLHGPGLSRLPAVEAVLRFRARPLKVLVHRPVCSQPYASHNDADVTVAAAPSLLSIEVPPFAYHRQGYEQEEPPTPDAAVGAAATATREGIL